MVRTPTSVIRAGPAPPIGRLAPSQPLTAAGPRPNSIKRVVAPGSSILRRFVGPAFAVLLAWAAFYPLPLRAQGKPAPEIVTHEVAPTFEVQSERNLVTVRVVVRNQKGEAVGNLHQKDFRVYDRGKRETIVQFSVENPAAEEAAPMPSQAQPGAAVKPPPAFMLRNRFVALFFDDVNTGFQGLARSRDAAERFIQASLHPGVPMQVGVFTTSGEVSLGFTHDLAKVRQALAALRPGPLTRLDEGCGAMMPYQAYLIAVLQDPQAIQLAQQEELQCSRLPQPPTEGEVRLEALRVQAKSERRATAALQAIDSLVGLMTPLAGQRSIVIVSDGFLSQTLGEAINRIADRALQANIVINGLDARALYLDEPLADASRAGMDQPSDPTLLAYKEDLGKEENLRQSEATGTLARNTGGLFIENTNDLEAGFRKTAGRPAVYYTLAFSPRNLKHNGAFHVLKVTLVSAHGLTVQARKGYYAPKKDVDLAEQKVDDLQSAVFSQNNMHALPIQVNTEYFETDKTDAELDVVTHVDLHRLSFRKEADRNLDTLTFVTAVFDQDGRYVSGQQKDLELRLRDDTLEKLLRTGVRVETEIKVKRGTYLVRTVVRDSASGRMSALNRTVEIPY